jgi:hypothetical protein
VATADARRTPDEAIGATAGILGSLIISMNLGVEFAGWLAFFISNIAMLAYARRVRSRWIMGMQACFMVSTMIGLVRWWPF